METFPTLLSVAEQGDEPVCAACGRALDRDAVYCGWCGTARVRSCPACAKENAAAHRFCDRCGTPLAETAAPANGNGRLIEGERRHLTVMFVDLVGSTPMSGRLDPEDLRNVVLRYQGRCVETIAAHDGFVANYQGDGILAFFGFPAAHEEDALQAVRAGLRIVADMPALAAELDIGDLSARVGVHTGLVVVGEMGAGASRVSADVVGETPNIAAHVQSLAEPGQVVITGSTRALVDGFVTVEPLGTQSLRGVDHPVPLFVVSGETSAEEPSRSCRGPIEDARSSGATPEMGVLLRCWEAARAGAGQVTVISGEPGIGKSRLVLELRDHVKADGGTVVGLRGSPHLRNSAMQPIIDHLRRATGIEHAAVADDALDRIKELVASITAGTGRRRRRDRRTARGRDRHGAPHGPARARGSPPPNARRPHRPAARARRRAAHVAHLRGRPVVRPDDRRPDGGLARRSTPERAADRDHPPQRPSAPVAGDRRCGGARPRRPAHR